MVESACIVGELGHAGVSFFCGVPDSLLRDLCAYLSDHMPRECNLITANEGTAVGLAAGHYLATGEVPLVYMQNSGIGNAVNPLLSLADERVYAMPIMLMIGWRGEPGVHDEPQHAKQGTVTLQLLEAMDIPYVVLPDDNASAVEAVRDIVAACRKESRPHAIVIRKDTFAPYKLRNRAVNDYPLSREEALQLVAGLLPADAIIVSTTGKLSRELYEYRDAADEGHDRDFLTVGSMGHSSSIALGIALARPDRQVVCLDGDGAFIMHMGALTNIGSAAPGNYLHILFNNGAHESVGGQPTLGFEIDLQGIARACGYARTASVATAGEIEAAIRTALSNQGPSLIEIKVAVKSRADLGRPKRTPIENKEAFMRFMVEGRK